MYRNKATRVMRKIQREMQKPHYDPDAVLDSLGIAPSYTDHKPSLKEYGLPEDIEEQIEQENVDFEDGKKRRAYTWFFAVIILGAVIGYILNGREGAFFGAFLGFWPTSFVAMGLVYDAELPMDDRKKRFEVYKNQKNAYEYWQRKKKKDHWQRLSGHAYEKALGNVFQQHGYEVEVTKGSGDEGIDLILTSKNDRIAVQAKNHIKPVGPAVARDLFGAMMHGNFERGMIVSSGGFTKGVYEFAKGKEIELVSLQEVIKIVDGLK